MIIGFDASRAFGSNRTGTENYSYQLLLNLAKIDHKNQYKVFLRPNSVIARSSSTPLSTMKQSQNSHPELVSGSNKMLKQVQHDKNMVARNDEKLWPENFEFITIPYPRLWTQAGLALQTFKDVLHPSKMDALFIPSHTLPLIRKPGLKTIVTVHDLGAEFLPKTHQLKQKAYLKFMTNFQLKSATHLIAVSNATKDDLINKVHLDPKNISVIYEGYDKTLYKPQKTDELKNVLNYYDLESNNYFLFVGTIQPRKNLERLIRAFSVIARTPSTTLGTTKQSQDSHPELVSGSNKMLKQVQHDKNIVARNDKVKLVLAGSRGWLSDEIYELPKKLGIENQVKFLGYVPDENLPALYNGAIAFLFPSLFEGFGLPVLEAMACECPVLTSNISSLPEVAGNAALLINPYSEAKIAQGINKLFYDQNLRNKLKKLGIAQVKKFSWQKCAKETLKVLFQIYTK